MRFPSAILLLPALLTLLSACSAEIAVVATPLSSALITEEHLESAKDDGPGRVIVLPPGDSPPTELLGPRIGRDTRILLMPDVEPEEVGYLEGRSYYRLRMHGDAADEGELLILRTPAFRRVGRLVADFMEKELENLDGAADTITVRVFALRGSEERLEELRALLEPIRSRLSEERISVEEVAPGFNLVPLQQRLREASPKDPLLIFLGAAGAELLAEAHTGERAVVGETLFVPATAEEIGDSPLEGEELLLLGVAPQQLFDSAIGASTEVVEATLYRVSDPF